MNARAGLLAAVACFGLAACETDTGPPLELTGIRLLAPVPGTRVGVGYLTLTNHSAEPVEITGAASPQFDRIEIHESVIEDDMATMRALDSLLVLPGESVVLQQGGKHLMLVGPGPDVAPGTLVTIEIRYGESLLIVSATLQDRIPGN